MDKTVSSSSVLPNTEQYIVSLEYEGRLTLPEAVQERLNLQPGSRLILKIDQNNTLQLVSLGEQVKKLRGILKSKYPERNLVDEIIQERREEADFE